MNRYYTDDAKRKISAGNGPKLAKAGGAVSMPQKQGYASTALPGKASNGFAGPKRGVREINGYASYNGLSQSSGGGQTSFRQGSVKDEQRGVFETVMDAEGIKAPIARSVGRVEYRGSMEKNRGDFNAAMTDLGGEANPRRKKK